MPRKLNAQIGGRIARDLVDMTVVPDHKQAIAWRQKFQAFTTNLSDTQVEMLEVLVDELYQISKLRELKVCMARVNPKEVAKRKAAAQQKQQISNIVGSITNQVVIRMNEANYVVARDDDQWTGDLTFETKLEEHLYDAVENDRQFQQEIEEFIRQELYKKAELFVYKNKGVV